MSTDPVFQGIKKVKGRVSIVIHNDFEITFPLHSNSLHFDEGLPSSQRVNSNSGRFNISRILRTFLYQKFMLKSKSTNKLSSVSIAVEYDNRMFVLNHVNNIIQSPRNKLNFRFDIYDLVPFLKIKIFGELPMSTLCPEAGVVPNSADDKLQLCLLGECTTRLNFRNAALERDLPLVDYRSVPIMGANGEAEPIGFLKLSSVFQAAELGMNINDFEMMKVVGQGSFGTVLQMRKRDSGEIFAVKTIDKSRIKNSVEAKRTLMERETLTQVASPFLIPLKYSFQSASNLYLVMPFIEGGDLYHHLTEQVRFPLDQAKLYMAELVCAFEELHRLNLIYRDLKPENVMLDDEGHVVLCDFGFCKMKSSDDELNTDICGTLNYMAPEVINKEGYDKRVDYWSLGVLLYEMLTGIPPFEADDDRTLYEKIRNDSPVYTPWIGYDARHLINGLMEKDPDKRLGHLNGFDDIKKEHFFYGIEWDKLEMKMYQPIWVPAVLDDCDYESFQYLAEMFCKDSEFKLSAELEIYFENWDWKFDSTN